jgi:hypothetical protein
VALLEIDATGEDGEAQPPTIPLMTAAEYQSAEVGRWLACAACAPNHEEATELIVVRP